jgi:hypothetical protein
MNPSPFRRCTCGHEWATRQDFLDDPEVAIVGYQVDFEALQLGLLLFNHRCRTTLAMEAAQFRDLYDGPVFAKKMTQEPDCPGYCAHRDNLERCPAECECAYVSEIVQIIRAWPKRPA